jgi:hypothetical protein
MRQRASDRATEVRRCVCHWRLASEKRVLARQFSTGETPVAHRAGAALAMVVAFTATVAGCGDAAVTTVPVQGRITLGGGDWPAEGLVVFAPKQPAEGYPAKSGQAFFALDGSFVAGTFKQDDGLVPGTYLVNLRCVESSPTDITQGVNHVPPKYQRGEDSGWEVVVPTDDSGPVTVEFDVPKA